MSQSQRAAARADRNSLRSLGEEAAASQVSSATTTGDGSVDHFWGDNNVLPLHPAYDIEMRHTQHHRHQQPFLGTAAQRAS